MSKNASIYLFSPKAKVDLEGIWLYTYETWSLAQADRYYNQIINACESLADDPEQGQNANNIRSRYRRFMIGKHFIFYRKTSDGIEIIRILHQQMDIPQHL